MVPVAEEVLTHYYHFSPGGKNLTRLHTRGHKPVISGIYPLLDTAENNCLIGLVSGDQLIPIKLNFQSFSLKKAIQKNSNPVKMPC